MALYFFFSHYQNLNVYTFLVTLGKVNRGCAFSDAVLKENNKVIKNGCNTLSTSSKECYCDTNFCNTNGNEAQQDIEFIETAEQISKSGAFSYLNDNLGLLSLMSTANIFLMKLCC